MDARTIHFHAVDTWTVDVEWIASLLTANTKPTELPLNLNAVHDAIEAAASVRFFGGSSLRILRQFLDKGLAGRIKCHLQVGSCDMSANLFANQFNIALNREAAKAVSA
ncbi:hypothetical protein FPOAC1_003977 [Fusarium poae]|uniref:hypothetical protein n=1 Tax=Fusarium poae TaxID=36050 RepID=UPI001CEA1EDE|nr:hypothetical protein FPOAC1_003977 [Fusarium poae]KAG8670743.1 hypothetical protein FPOAC1_003977 [Fusarium poae]